MRFVFQVIESNFTKKLPKSRLELLAWHHIIKEQQPFEVLSALSRENNGWMMGYENEVQLGAYQVQCSTLFRYGTLRLVKNR